MTSSVDFVREILRTHDIVFTNRPRTTPEDILYYGCMDIGVSPYGDYWRQVRKICVVELLSMRVLTFQFVREEVETMKRKAQYIYI